MEKVTELQNIGSALAVKLRRIGIENAEQLRELGSEKAFSQLKHLNPELELSVLYSLEGAIMNIKWRFLGIDRKEELKNYFKTL